MAMDKQMELFEEGGLMDEGNTVDPMSGNEVPVGSTQEEVRDDIPAQLSEGEFVLPADVVRYHGLDKIMALRDEAKAGLARMEAMGQMGNSDEAIIPDDVPFDIDDLDMEDEEEQGELNFAVGGNVSGTAFTPLPATATAAAPVAAGTAAAPVTAASSAYIPQLQGTKFTPSSTAPARSPTFYQTVGTPFIPQGPQTTTGTTPTAPTTSTTGTTTGGGDDSGGGFDGTAGPVTTGTVTGYTSPSSTMSEVGGFLTKDVETNANAFGGNKAFGMSNKALRNATFDQAMYQLGSISPMGAIGSALSKEFGFTNATMNDMAVAGQQAKEAALTTLGFTRASQIQTNNQATMYGTMISAAHAAAKKGEDVTVALAKEMSNPAYAAVVKDAAVSAMKGLGYTPDQMSNPASVNAAIGGYRAAADAYRSDAEQTRSSGTVRDSKGNPVTSRSGVVMTQSARDRMNAELEAAKTAEAKANSIAAEQARSRGNVARDDAVYGEPTDTDVSNAKSAAAAATAAAAAAGKDYGDEFGNQPDNDSGSSSSSSGGGYGGTDSGVGSNDGGGGYGDGDSDSGGGTDGGGSGGGGGGDDGGTYICTASYANGIIPRDHFTSLKKYGIMLRRNDPYLMKAYDWFGPVLASKVKDGKLSTFAKHTTDLWKYNQTKHSDVSFNIKIMSQFHKAITRPVLRVLGRVLVIKEKIYK
jgi:hypothetical protein